MMRKFLLLLVLPFSVYAANIDVAFSPGDDALNLVLATINSAHNSICMAAYSFTSKPVANALLSAQSRGVKITLIADKNANSHKHGVTQLLAHHGIDVRLTDQYPIMHNKFIEVDDKTVETGSFNYSYMAAHENAENVIVVWNKPRIANIYAKQCNQLYATGEQLYNNTF